MHHAGLMNEREMGPETGPLQRSRLHIRGGRRRIRQGKIAAGIVTLADALSAALEWYVSSPERRARLGGGKEAPDTVYLDLFGSGTDEHVVGGIDYTDSATVVNLLSVESTEEHTTYDSDTVYNELSVDSTEVAEFVDTDTVYNELSVESTEEQTTYDTEIVYNELTTLSAELAEFVDADTIYNELC